MSAGCLGENEDVARDVEDENRSESDDSDTTDDLNRVTPEDRNDPCADFESISRLGSAAGVSIEADPEREYEYLEDEDRVRYEYDHGGTNEMAFDEWGTRRATEVAASHVASVLDEKDLEESGIAVGYGTVDRDDLDGADGDPESTEFDRAIPFGVSVDHVTSYSRGGTRLTAPEIDFQSLVQATPKSITVTMRFDEREYTAVLPVICERLCVQDE